MNKSIALLLLLTLCIATVFAGTYILIERLVYRNNFDSIFEFQKKRKENVCMVNRTLMAAIIVFVWVRVRDAQLCIAVDQMGSHFQVYHLQPTFGSHRSSRLRKTTCILVAIDCVSHFVTI